MAGWALDVFLIGKILQHFLFLLIDTQWLTHREYQKTRVFFRFKFSVWRIERTGERHKTAQILRFAFPGDTAFMLKIR